MTSIFINNKEFKKLDINPKYFISNDGEVYSQNANKILKIAYRGKYNKQYPYVCIYYKGKQRKFSIHRLVYHTWVSKLSEHQNVNHIDDNLQNCFYKNLYVGSQKDNIKDCIKNNHRVGNIFYLTLYLQSDNPLLEY